jgi:hypothetical protein
VMILRTINAATAASPSNGKLRKNTPEETIAKVPGMLINTPGWGYGPVAQGKRSATLGMGIQMNAPLKGVRAQKGNKPARTPFRGANL